MKYTLEEAKVLDKQDELKDYKKLFHIPKLGSKKETKYFCGNSLGLQPKAAKSYFDKELKHWAEYGVEGHTIGENAWLYYHHLYTESISKIVGAKKNEVVCMNTLTVNLHILMFSFYKPTKKRYKIIMEGGAFPSDQYAMETQVKMHGLKPKDAIIELIPRKGENTLRTSDILDTIQNNRSSLALIMIGGVNYYTGQLYDIPTITKAGQKAGALVSFDLAHAAGNVPLQLHKWGVDFACWCSYKYLNSGPGGVSGIYIHEKHATNPNTFRLAGWWGHDEATRFQMKKGFKPMPDASSWQMSNAPIFNMVAHRASLDIFDKVGMNALRKKSIKLTEFLYSCLMDCNHLDFEIITPKSSKERGAQISLLFKKNGKQIFDHLAKNHIIADWREPNVIRISPIPLYNSFQDIFELYLCLKKIQ